MNKAKLIFFIVVSALILHSCSDDWRRSRNSGTWTSSDPESIPYNIRMKEFKSGNLVPNPSFEEGHPKTSDSTVVQNIKKWEIIGAHVYLLENSEDTLVAVDGKRAVCIRKPNADETDTLGDGIISDFSPVIPGNYDFSMLIKAENIKPQYERLGTKLFDAVNIRLQFYDDRKQEISPAMYYPYTSSHIDNGFKAYGFSNFYVIDSLDWSIVHARTYNYPWSEGDIPDQCRFVKIFIGLKGSGTLWVDQVSLSYSKWNFTTKERMGWYREKTFRKEELLIPAPLKCSFVQNMSLISAGMDKVLYPSVVLAAPKTASNLNTQNFLSENLKNTLIRVYPECEISLPGLIDADVLDNSSVIFMLTNYNRIDTTSIIEQMPGISARPQSYVITDTIIKDKRIVVIAAGDDLGLFYGVTTVVRLLDERTAQYSHCQILDYPYYTGRGFQLSAWDSVNTVEKDLENLDYLTFYRFNKAYLPYYQNPEAKHWHQIPPSLHEGTAKIGEYVKAKGTIEMGVMFNPYYHFDYEMHVSAMSDSLKYIWQHDEKGMELIKTLLRPAFENGASFFMLLGDDFVPHSEDYRKLYDLWTEEDILKHTNLQSAQAYAINKLRDWMNTYPGFERFEFCPPWYLNEFVDKSRGRAEAYFRDLQRMIPQDVVIVWTGNTVRSLRFDDLDVKRYQDMAGRQIMLWDNTLYARSLEGTYGGYPSMYPGKIKLCNIFEPWDVDAPADFYKVSPHFYSNGMPNTEIYKIKYATLADYQWNPQAYNPELSLWKVLVLNFGNSTAWKLIEFNDSYFRLMENVILLEKESKESSSLENKTKHLIKDIRQQLSILNKELKNVNPALFQELETLFLGLETRFQNIDKRKK